ncbi:hypothetical protein AVEN_157501-1 [Araneus ventricosus]|uniref:Uncharacterized protein n=1 Tax=Araneus ventricosus TaxID=182803 RepID=A0A4Y2GXS6_ARAVE|nr:hypothetical protein AVEN_157501-1 [Araneus ventricosus]
MITTLFNTVSFEVENGPILHFHPALTIDVRGISRSICKETSGARVFHCHHTACQEFLTSSWNRISADMIRNCFAPIGLCEGLDEKLLTVIEYPEECMKSG